VQTFSLTLDLVPFKLASSSVLAKAGFMTVEARKAPETPAMNLDREISCFGLLVISGLLPEKAPAEAARKAANRIVVAVFMVMIFRKYERFK